MSDFTEELDVAREGARAAGEVALRSYARLKEADINEKRANDMVTVVDLEAQDLIVSRIRSRFPTDYIVAEEKLPPEVNAGIAPDSSRRWYIDPLDGTTNYIHAFPMFAVSIGLEVDGEMVVGVTYGPIYDELYHAVRGGGAYLNDSRISVSNVEDRNRLFLGTGFPFRARQYLDDYLKTFRYFFNHSRGLRRGGSAALDFAFVAAGRLDGFWELTLSPWDMAAGTVLVEEAGGRVTDFHLGSSYLELGHVVASNGIIHDWMSEEVSKVFPPGATYDARD